MKVPKVFSAPKDFLSSEECKALFDKIVSIASGGGDTTVSIVSQWSGLARWARNRMHIASDIRNTDIRISRSIRGAGGYSNTSRLDSEGLEQAVREAEVYTRLNREHIKDIEEPFIDEPILNPTLWGDKTYSFGAGERTDLVQSLIQGAEDAGFSSAGELKIAANGTTTISSQGMFRYYPQTVVECSMTVRHPKGLASGWAGVNHYDLARIDPKELAAKALDKCQRSMNPVAIEPGRYTTILEPQATADMFQFVVNALERRLAEIPSGPFGKAPGLSKITEQVLDRRLILSADPMDPEGGFIPFDRYDGTPYQPVAWIDQGILRELDYDRRYALAVLGLDKALLNSKSYHLTAAPGVPTTTVEDMISKTERGILVTRFSNIQEVDGNSVLLSGYTRDGLWLIEKGKITKPIKNFRFTESPMFALNNLEDIGTPQRVFSPGLACLAPAVRVRDFSFTSLADAV